MAWGTGTGMVREGCDCAGTYDARMPPRRANPTDSTDSTGAADRAAPRRADAARNIAAILRAATELLASRPDVSMAEVARSAGVGRVTLYSHFSSRAELVDAVITQVMAETHDALEGAALDELSPEDALRRLVATSWQIVERFNRLRIVAGAELGESRLRDHHDRALAHVERLVLRGRRAGAFRTDLPVEWTVTACYALMHAAAEEVATGRLQAAEVPDVLAESILPMLRAPR